jgi:S-formylglutathione hydrolase FrmB
VDLVEWIDADPFFARDVQDWQAGQKLTFSADNCLAYPRSLAELAPNTYRVQAVMGINDWSQDPINAPGNGYSDVAVFKWTGERPVTVRLRIAKTFPPPKLVDRENRKYVSVRSERLSAFHGRDVYLRAAVGLPEAYWSEPDRSFPAVYTIPGFGGAWEHANPEALVGMLGIQGLEAVVVHLDASCPTGHHVFADSANNGPWGTALVTELIPHLEAQFRLLPEAGARYVMGHSSGGWSSLWLQVTHPDMFGGAWSTSPDPVDFTAFMQINIYEAEANLFYAKGDTPVCLTRPGAFGIIRAKELCALETVLGRGGQMGSFEAVFSPRGSDGRPARLWDRTSGRIDPQVAAAWRQYDLRHVLESNWPVLGPKLTGKLHIFCGDQDDFFLDQGVRKLADALKKLGSDAQVEIIPGANHMLPPRVFAEIARQMAEQFEQYDKNRQRG